MKMMYLFKSAFYVKMVTMLGEIFQILLHICENKCIYRGITFQYHNALYKTGEKGC